MRCGSGGTLAGVTEFLKPKGVKVGLVDPMGAALFSYFKEGVLASSGSSITEGIGQGRITENLKGFVPDYAYQVEDEEALNIVFDLMENEGLCLGSSSGINIAGAKRLANDLGKGCTVVTIYVILVLVISQSYSTRSFCSLKVCQLGIG